MGIQRQKVLPQSDGGLNLPVHLIKWLQVSQDYRKSDVNTIHTEKIQQHCTLGEHVHCDERKSE